jgi:hypothetical protein
MEGYRADLVAYDEAQEVFRKSQFLYETDAVAHARAVRAAQAVRAGGPHELGALEYMRALEGAMVAVYLAAKEADPSTTPNG